MTSAAPFAPPVVLALPPVVGILLAGGAGRRFAAQQPGADKLLATLPDGRAVLAAAAGPLLAALPAVVAVVPADRPARAALLRKLGCTVLESDRTADGLGASLAVAAGHLLAGAVPPAPAASAAPGASPSCPPGVVVALGDMPWIDVDVIRAVAQAIATHRAAAPLHDGQRGHPVGFCADLLPALARLSGDTGARAVLQQEAVHGIHVDYPGVLRDVDLPADLAG